MDLRKMILQEEHDPKVASHMGQEQTIELVGRTFVCSQMDQCIEE
jgi:hypothetical protein